MLGFVPQPNKSFSRVFVQALTISPAEERAWMVGILYVNIYLEKMLDFDRRAAGYFASLELPWLVKFMKILTHLGSGAFWLAGYVFLIFYESQISSLVFVLILAEIIGFSAVILLKYMTKRSRPDRESSFYHYILWNKYSFPSQHSLRAFMVAMIFGTTYPAFLPFLILVAVTISFSRLCLLKHYFSDVFTGALFGIIIGLEAPIIMS